MNLSDLINLARWDAYDDKRHCHQRRKAFERDAAKAITTWQWSAKRMPSGTTVVRLAFYLRGDVNKWDGFHQEDVPPVGGYLASCVERLILEALRDVARETKKRLAG